MTKGELNKVRAVLMSLSKELGAMLLMIGDVIAVLEKAEGEE